MAFAHPKPGLGKFSVVTVPGDGFAVKDPDGKISATIYARKAWAVGRAAQRQLQADKAARRGPRPCMNCQTQFLSEGIHNRLCKTCRGATDVLGEAQRPFIGSRN